MKRFTFLDAVLLLIFSLTGILVTAFTFSRKGSVVRVEAAGEVYEYPLEADGIYEVEGALGKTVFEITESRVHITESACPNKICVAAGFSSPIVCLPNQVIITVEDEEGEAFDAVAQ